MTGEGIPLVGRKRKASRRRSDPCSYEITEMLEEKCFRKVRWKRKWIGGKKEEG